MKYIRNGNNTMDFIKEIKRISNKNSYIIILRKSFDMFIK